MTLPNYSGILSQLSIINNSLSNITGISYNAILTIPQGSGDVVVDDFGNYTVENVTNISIQCKLVQKKDPNIMLNAGVDQVRTYLVGHLVNPLYFNGAIPDKIPCSLLQNNLWVDGILSLIDNIPTEINENTSIQHSLGQKIQGYFETTQTSI
jgi:hypothetical protein